MNFSLKQIYDEFNRYKENKDFAEYFNEQNTNNNLLNSNPFNWKSAQQQIGVLTAKYKQDLNWIANLSGNGRWVTSSSGIRTPEQYWSDLKYINDQIPLIALKRKGNSEVKKRLLGL